MDNRSDPNSSDDPFAGGGGAVDDLTPPTMKYGPDSLPTQPLPPPTGVSQNSPPAGERALDATMVGPPNLSPKARPGRASEALNVPARSSGVSPTIGGHAGAATILASDVPTQDLSNEKLLRDAPRLESSGKICPSLNGIPLLSKLGQGGMGAVYYGIHPRLRSEVAVKVLPFHLAAQDPGMIQRFFREAQIAAKVRSPHLVSVIDVNEESGLFFLVMEYVAGITMGQYIKQLAEKGTIGMDELDAIDVCLAACLGLDAAHQHGIVHRDLKPENIMVPYKSRQNKTFDLKGSKLMDLGLARSEEGNQSLTGVQAAMGTPGYMSPEQALDAKTADKRSDVFGMGATIYALLSGRPPFGGKDKFDQQIPVMKVIMATMHEPHEPITTHRPDISPALCEVIERCLDKRPENRYNDAHQLIRALRNCRKLLAPDSVFVEDDRDSEGADPMLTTARIPRSATPGVNPHLRLSTSGQRGAPAMAQPKKKWPLFAGIGAAALLTIGAVAYALRPGDKGPDNDPNKVIKLPPQQNLKPLTDTEKKFAIDEHNGALEAVKLYLKNGNIPAAENKFTRGLKADQDVPQLPELAAAWEGVRQEIGLAKSRQAFVAIQNEFELKVASGKLADAEAVAQTLVPADADQTKIKEGLLQQLKDAKLQQTNKEEANRLLAEANMPGGLLEDKLKLVKRALEKVPNDKVALERRDELDRQLRQASNLQAVSGLLNAALDDYNRRLYEGASDKIAQIKLIDPENKEALKLENDIKPLLDDKKRGEREASNRKAAYTAYNEAVKFYDANDAENAMKKIKSALSFEKKETYDNLKTAVEILADDLARMEKVKQLKSQALETLNDAEKLIIVVDNPSKEKGLDEALTRINEAAKFKLAEAAADLNIDNKNLDKAVVDLKQQVAGVKSRSDDLKQQIDTRRTMLGEMQRYDKLVNDANTILVENDKDGSLQQIATALGNIEEALRIVESGKSVKDGARAKELQTQLKGKQTEIKARETKRTEVKTRLATGDEAVAAGKFADALAAYKEADPYAKGLAKETADVATKIEEANKMLAAEANIDRLAKEENFDQALKELSALAKSAGDAAVAARKTDLDTKKRELDGIVASAFSTTAAALKTGTLADAIKTLEPAAATHKGRPDLSAALNGLKEIQTVDNDIKGKLVTLQNDYDRLNLKSYLVGRSEIAAMKASLATLRNLTKDSLSNWDAARLANAASAGQAVATKRTELINQIRGYTQTLDAVRPPPPRAETVPDSGSRNNGGRPSVRGEPIPD